MRRPTRRIGKLGGCFAVAQAALLEAKHRKSIDTTRNNKSRVFSYAIPRESKGPLAIETFHAKIVLADRDRAYIGSSNMNLASREISMERGVTLTGPCVRPVATLIDTIVSISIAL